VIKPAVQLWTDFCDAISRRPDRRQLIRRLDFRPFNCVEYRILALLPSLTNLHTLYHYHPGTFNSSRFRAGSSSQFGIFDELKPMPALRRLHVEFDTGWATSILRLLAVTPRLELLEVDGTLQDGYLSDKEEDRCLEAGGRNTRGTSDDVLAELRHVRLRIEFWLSPVYHLTRLSPDLETLAIESPIGDSDGAYDWTEREQERYRSILQSKSIRHCELYNRMGENVSRWTWAHSDERFPNLESLFYHIKVSF